MIEFLKEFNKIMKDNDIPYSYHEWKKSLSYPYFVGEFFENGHSYEDGSTIGRLEINGWTRNEVLELYDVVEKIKDVCEDLVIRSDKHLFYIRYVSTNDIPTDDNGLSRVMITCDVTEWKGE